MSEKIKDILILVIFFITITIVFLFNIIKKDDTISTSERRKLQQFPEISYKYLIDGTFFDKFEKYTTDQFVFRENLRTFKASLDLKLKKNYHKIYVKDDYLIEQLYPLSEDSIKNITNKITYIKNQYLIENNNIYFSIIPDKNYFVNDNITPKINYDNLKNNICNELNFITYIDIFNELKLNDYYKTDGHWKQENLINVATKLLKGMNSYNFQVSYEQKILLNFKGAYAYQLPIKVNYDQLNILYNDTIKSATVYNYSTNNYEDIYNLNKINSLDKYDIYLSGSQPLLTINNNLNNNQKELIIFRDSFSSSLAPLLLHSYSKITLIDTRYISPTILDNFIDFNNKNIDILFIYSTTIINNSYSLK